MSLPESYSAVPLADPARAEANLESLRTRLSRELLDLLSVILAQAPDPDTALNNLERFTRVAPKRALDGLAKKPALLHYLLALFSHSRYLTETLILQPELVLWLAREKSLTRLKSADDLLEACARFEATAIESDPALILTRFKRREYLRIALKDIQQLATLTETTIELSLLADVLLERASRIAGRELERRFGWPHAADDRGRPVRARFAVVSLGKLGGSELNYSSDIDLLFLYDGEGETPGGESGEVLAGGEFFLRLAQRILQLIAGLTSEGPVFRVDVRLRPGGGEGDLVISLPAAVEYYRSRAREWELQMLLKARATAGNARLVRDFLRQVEPFLYREEMHFDVVESVLNAREQFDRKLRGRRDARIDVKLSPGGIRDIEFLVQCLQRLYGRADRWVRSAGTLLGLQRLTDKGYLAPRDHNSLAAAYQFLRLVEHRLQLDQGLQTHQVPEDSMALRLLARRCRSEGAAGHESEAGSEAGHFLRVLSGHRETVREIYARVLPYTRRALESEPFRLVPPEEGVHSSGLEYAALLHTLGNRSEELREAASSLELPAGGHKAFQRFLTAAAASPAALEALTSSTNSLPLAAELLARSRPLADLLIRQPERAALLPGLWAPDAGDWLPFPREPGREKETVPEIIPPGASSIEAMTGLRRYHRDQFFRWGCRSLWETGGVAEALETYSGMAQQIVESAWHASCDSAREQQGGTALLALGRLGMRELDLGSDLDLLFVAADQDAAARARPRAERFIHMLSAYTQQGSLFQVDTRLRPRGKEGELVQTVEGALDYFQSAAELWEAAAYLKVTPLSIGRELGADWCGKLRHVLGKRFHDWDAIRAGLRQMRQRLETEGGQSGGGGNYKTGAGGVYDIDFILSALALRSGELELGERSLAAQAHLLREKEILSAEDAGTLIGASQFFRAVDHAVRLATGRSSPVLPAGPRGLAAAQLAGRWLGEPLSPAGLATRLADHCRYVRRIFNRIFSA